MRLAHFHLKRKQLYVWQPQTLKIQTQRPMFEAVFKTKTQCQKFLRLHFNLTNIGPINATPILLPVYAPFLPQRNTYFAAYKTLIAPNMYHHLFHHYKKMFYQ